MGLQNKVTEKPLKFKNKKDQRLLPPDQNMLFDPLTDPDTPLVAGVVPFPIHNFLEDNDHILEALHKCPLSQKMIGLTKKTYSERVAKSAKF
jgi:hypothetical protein